jgi:hypothetical protein
MYSFYLRIKITANDFRHGGRQEHDTNKVISDSDRLSLSDFFPARLNAQLICHCYVLLARKSRAQVAI